MSVPYSYMCVTHYRSCAQYRILSEIVHVLKAIAIVIRVHPNISMIFVLSHFLSAQVTPE